MVVALTLRFKEASGALAVKPKSGFSQTLFFCEFENVWGINMQKATVKKNFPGSMLSLWSSTLQNWELKERESVDLS